MQSIEFLMQKAYDLAMLLEQAGSTNDRVWGYLDGLMEKFLQDWMDGRMSIADSLRLTPELIEAKFNDDIEYFNKLLSEVNNE